MNEIVAPFDWQRMFFGEQPFGFYFEILFRTLVIYLYAFTLIRWLGSRTVGQLSTVEFLLVIALGSAVGDPMFYPDVPLLHALIVVTVLILANKGLDLLVARTHWGEAAIDGQSVEIVRDGIIDYRAMHDSVLGQQEFFQQMRIKGIETIGQVERAYLEPEGQLSVFCYPKGQERPGLRIVPPPELSAKLIVRAGEKAAPETTLACIRCGQPVHMPPETTIPPCPNCHFPRYRADIPLPSRQSAKDSPR